MKKILKITLFFLAMGIAALGFAEKTLYVSSSGAALKADRSASADTIAELSSGTLLMVLDFQDRWYKVSTPDEKIGWIYRGKVSETPPGEEMPSTDDLLGDLGDSGILLAAADTSRSIRGKKQEDGEDGSVSQERLPESEKAFLNALNRILEFYTSDAEVAAFLKEGKIGEYR